MEWWQTLVVALVSPVLPTGALFLQQRRAHEREDRIRAEDRVDRARDRWRNDQLTAHALLLVRLNRELDAFRSAVEAVVHPDPEGPGAGGAWKDDDPVLVEEALAPVQLVGSAHAAGTAEHAYTQLLLARSSLSESLPDRGAVSDAAKEQLRVERQTLFEAIQQYRIAARADLLLE